MDMMGRRRYKVGELGVIIVVKDKDNGEDEWVWGG